MYACLILPLSIKLAATAHSLTLVRSALLADVDLQVLCDKHRPAEGAKKRKRSRESKW